MTLVLAESENVGGMHAAIADRFAAEDEARREWLNAMVHGGGQCRYCGAKVSDRSMDRAPGVCSHPGCQRKGRRDAQVQMQCTTASNVEAEGEQMPKGYRRGQACKTCESRGTRHKAGCAEAGEEAATRATPARREEIVRSALKVKTAKAADDAVAAQLAGYTVTQLLALIVACQAELDRRENDLQEQLVAIRTSRAA